MNENQIEKLTEYYNHNYPKRQNQTLSDVKEITAGWETKLSVEILAKNDETLW